jgi:hypothetical protein
MAKAGKKPFPYIGKGETNTKKTGKKSGKKC